MAKQKSISPSNKKASKRRIRPLLLLIAVVILVAIWGWFQRESITPQEVAPTTVVMAVPERELILYFATVDGLLVSETRMLPDGGGDSENIRSTILALIAGPTTSDLLRVLPESARLLNLNIQESLAILDFSREFVAAHPGGSVSELLTIYALVDSLAVNFPYVRQVRIQVDGKDVETIKGHADLRRPISVDFSYVNDTDEAAHADAVGELIEKHGSGETQ
jgi:spore germination protein GerM